MYCFSMKNITVTLDEKTAAWARAYAARRNMSLSCFLEELIHEKMSELREYENAMQRFFAIKPKRLSAGEPYPSRDEIYERKILR
jgi:tetrahydromethanopterin S-methyltransferase subunit B